MVEFDFANTQPEHIAAAVRAHGVAILRGAVDPDIARRIKAQAELIYGAHRARAIQTDTPAARYAAAFFEGMPADYVARIDDGSIVPQVFDAKYGGDPGFYAPVADAKLRAAMALVLGEGFRSQAFDTINRTANGSEPQTTLGIPFHTDGAYYNDHLFALTAWVPLDACGVDAPGLYVVAAGHDEVRSYARYDYAATAPETPFFNFHRYRAGAFKGDAITAAFGERVLAPRFAPGDMALFSNWCIHATQRDPSMTRARSAMQIRFEGETFDPL